MMRLRHPGTITFINGNTGEVVKKRPVEEVPMKHRFVKTPDGEIPIVRVVATTTGNTRSIVEFGPNDQVLKTTGQSRR